MVGQTLFDAMHNTKSETILTYDLSKPVLDAEASYNKTDQGNWVVIVQCTAAPGVEALGVIPKLSASDSLLQRAKSGDFRSLLVECGVKKSG